ncbi:sensor histidine kinase [Paenibacillus sp. S150]|uniref:cache domain-containing sensor histidine kinase n=1 Tax=Paenibacillus sp. S150 TaxID=2749826 RepID=UPI001C5925FE|nr:sensor histidine kinase [Paenibacillus sp. S150]MBW4084328.1 sensor histidine kinase [Paenibacillus sp. S150]
MRSIRSKLIATVLAVIAAPTLIVLYNYFQTSVRLVEQEVYAANQSLIEQAAMTINDKAKRMIQATYLLEADMAQSFGPFTFNWDYGNAEAMGAIFQIQKRMGYLRDILLDNSAFIGLADAEGNVVTTLNNFNRQATGDILREPWFKAGIGQKGYPYWERAYRLPVNLGYTENAPDKEFMLLARSFAFETSIRNAGLVVVGIPVSQFYGISSSQGLPDHTELLVLDQDGALYDIYGKQQYSLMPEQMEDIRNRPSVMKKLPLDNEIYLMNAASVPQVGISIVSLQRMRDFSAQLDNSRTKSIALFLLFFGVGIIIVIYILLRLTKPLYALVRSMSRVGSGNFSTKVEVRGRDEVALLGSHFNKMVAQLEELIHHVAEEQRHKEEAHFQALQAQINPHFLFNTLNSIKLMAMLSGTNRNVSDMITALGKLMEFSMKQNTLFVTLGQELEYLELYMSLQKIRYHDDITISIQVPEALLECTVLKFTLQPLVENSIIHGSKLPLHIRIEAERTDQYILIHIRDNGQGISQETMQAISEQLLQDHVKTSGIGLLNVDRRIKIHFGQECGILLSRPEEGGLQVTVRIPYRKELEG